MDSNKTGLSVQKISRALLKSDDKAKVQILVICLLETQDENWVLEGLSGFDQEKIKFASL